MDFSVGLRKKLRYKHIVFALGVVAFFALFCLLMVPFLVFAAGPPYQPGETLNPDCLPTNPNCTVVAPPAGTGSAGALTYWLATSTVSSTPLLFWDDSNLRLGIGTSTAVANALLTIATSSNILTVLSNGNVGIGTTGPITQLHVPGSVPGGAVGSAGTNTWPVSVYVQGRYAYVITALANTLQIFDVSNPSSPTSTGSVETINTPDSIYVQGRYAYVVETNGNKLQIFDVSNPSAPTSTGSVGAISLPRSVYVQGRYAYVVNSNPSVNKLQIFDVSNPSSPTSTGSAGTNNGPNSVYVQGRYAYVANSGSSTLQVFNVSNPSSPTSVGSAGTGVYPVSVYVQGRYAYVANSGSSTLQIFDVSNPSAPTSTGSAGTNNGPNSVYVQGRYAYVVNQTSSTLQVFDVSNPSAPTSVGSVGTNNGPNSVYVQGRYAYVANYNSSTLQVFDVGGAYIQQFEAGGIEAGTLSVRNNLQAVDASFQGGVNIGQSLQVSGNVGIQGNSNIAGALTVGTTTAVVNALLTIATSSTNVLTVLASGNVGIGTTAPWSALQVAGVPPGSTTSTLVLLGNNFITGGNVSGTLLGANLLTFNGEFVNFQVASTSKFKVVTSGGVITAGGITAGATITATQITSNYSGSDVISLTGALGASSTWSALRLGSNPISGGNASGTWIGSNPSTGFKGDFIDFQVGSSIKFLVNSSGSLTIATGTPAANALLTIATSSNIFTVLNSGNVGIGTVSPGTALEVAGVVSSTGMIFVNATGTNLTITGIVSSTQFRAASSSLNGLTFVNATSTGWLTVGTASATNLWFVNATGTGNLRAGTLNIGTSTPASSTALLTVATGTNIFTVGNRGVVLINATSGIYNASPFMATSSLIVCARTNCTASSTASTTNTVAFFASTDGSGTSNSIIARGSISAGQADIGEYANVVGDEADYEAGDVLSVSSAEPGKFEKSSTAYDAKLAGVVTETAGLVAGGGEDDHGSTVIALQGRLPVKVTGANGLIAVGDYLTSSDIPGYAQKATAAGRVVAIAMEAFDGATSADKGKILAFIEKSYYPGANVAGLSSAPVGQSLQGGSAGVGSTLNTYTFDPNMVYSFENLKAQNLEIGSRALPSGITIYDTQTKNPYCIIVENGVLKAVPGKCGEGVTTGVISAPSFVPATNVNTNSTVTATASTSETASPPADSASTVPPPDSVDSSSTTVGVEGALDAETSVTEAAATVDATSTDSTIISDVSSADASGAAIAITPEATSVVASTTDTSVSTSSPSQVSGGNLGGQAEAAGG